MTGAVFAKRYQDPHRAAAATAHRDWLARLECGVRVPALRSAEPHQLVFEHLGHQQPGPGDLEVLTQALGRMHAAAYTRQLHAARLNEPFSAPCGLVITDFVTPRRDVMDRLPLLVAGLPAAFYKDSNIRNFLLTDNGVTIVDFDDLTLAPFGYDLAKLVVSTAMTHGRLDPNEIEQALQTYNTHTTQPQIDTTCSTEQLRLYTEFHHLLTTRYLHRNGYRHTWPDVRPWREPEVPR
ncbi:MAG: phosphotransferase [Pseudonocardiales bacterium]